MLQKLLTYLWPATQEPTPQPPLEKKQEIQHAYKIVLVGDGGVGKTSFVNRLGNDNFYRTYIPTMGVNVASLCVAVETSKGSKEIAINLWDTAGQEKFGGLRDAYYKGCSGCIILFASNDRSTFKTTNSWYKDIRRVTENIVPIVLAGTKSDATTQQSREKIKVSIPSNSTNYFFAGLFSSKTGDNLFAPLETLLRKILDDDETKILNVRIL